MGDEMPAAVGDPAAGEKPPPTVLDKFRASMSEAQKKAAQNAHGPIEMLWPVGKYTDGSYGYSRTEFPWLITNPDTGESTPTPPLPP